MKKLDWSFLRIFFLIVSLLIMVSAFFVPDNNTQKIILSSLIIIALVVLDVQAPKIAKLSSDNPKIKTLRNINKATISVMILIIIFVRLKPIDGKVSKWTTEILLVGAVSIFMMIFGNIAPKIPFNRYVGLRLPWTIRDGGHLEAGTQDCWFHSLSNSNNSVYFNILF